MLRERTLREQLIGIRDGQGLVVCIGCGKLKRRSAAPAFDLYLGQYFIECLATARSLVTDSCIYVLSAKHGLLGSDDVVAPYDLRLADLSKEERLEWAVLRKQELGQVVDGRPVVFICGKIYHGAFDGLKFFPSGLGIGSQMKFMKQFRDTRKGLLDGYSHAAT